MKVSPVTPNESRLTRWLNRFAVERSFRRRVLLVLYLGYAVFIGWNFAPVAGSADCAGYMGSAKLLTEEKLTREMRTIPEFAPPSAWPYTPLGYLAESGSSILKPSYPVGLPLHYAFASKILGWYWGPVSITVLAAVGGVLLCHLLLGQFGLNPALSVIGATALAVSPMLLYVSGIPLSDGLAMMWCTAAAVFAMRGQKSFGWSIASGFAFSIAVLVRPSNLLLGPVIALLLFNLRSLFGAGLGGIPGAIFTGLYNYQLYRSPWRSGYGGISSSFAYEYFAPSLKNYLQTFPFVLPLAFAALLLLPALPWRERGREMAALLLWCFLFIGAYAFYNVTAAVWWYLRFLLPAFPPLIVLSLLGIQRLCDADAGLAAKRWRRALPAAALACSVIASVFWTHHHRITHLGNNHRNFVDTAEWMQANLPKNALIACMELSGCLYFYTGFPILRWDCTSPDDYRQLTEALNKSQRPFYAAFFLGEEESALKAMPARWTKTKTFRFFTVWEYHPL